MIKGVLKIITRDKGDFEKVQGVVGDFNKKSEGISFLIFKKEQKSALNSWMLVLDRNSPLTKKWGAYKLNQILDFIDSAWGPEYDLYVVFFANDNRSISKFIEVLKNKGIPCALELMQ